MPAPSRRNVLLRHHAAPCRPFNVGHLYMGLCRYYKCIFKTGTEVLSIVLHTCSSNTRSCLECRLKGETLLLLPRNKREDAHISCDARLKSQSTIRCCCSTTFISLPIREYCQPFYPFVSRCICVRACDKDVLRVFESCRETLAAMVACVEEVCKIWIWLFRNVRGEGFEGSSVVRMAQGKTCFRLPFCRQEAVKARQKAVTANLNSRDLMYRLGPAPKNGTWSI